MLGPNCFLGIVMRHMFKACTALVCVTLVGISAGVPLTDIAYAADDTPVERRVYKLEKEMKAVQRKVFPKGAPVQPDMEAETTAPTSVPASTPVSDLLSRVAGLESQLATMTGQIEKNSYRLGLIEKQLETMKAQEAAAAPRPSVSGPVSGVAGASSTTQPAAASEARKLAVAAIERPDSGNEANDAYVYGFRLWDAKYYPEAQVQLKTVVEKYGSTSVGSRAQNLLGRAYLDDGKPALASVAFYENYQKRPEGDRASQSLAYLGDALIQLKKPADACKVYGELEQSYGEDLSNSLREMMERGRTRAKCGR